MAQDRYSPVVDQLNNLSSMFGGFQASDEKKAQQAIVNARQEELLGIQRAQEKRVIEDRNALQALSGLRTGPQNLAVIADSITPEQANAFNLSDADQEVLTSTDKYNVMDENGNYKADVLARLSDKGKQVVKASLGLSDAVNAGQVGLGAKETEYEYTNRLRDELAAKGHIVPEAFNTEIRNARILEQKAKDDKIKQLNTDIKAGTKSSGVSTAGGLDLSKVKPLTGANIELSEKDASTVTKVASKYPGLNVNVVKNLVAEGQEDTSIFGGVFGKDNKLSEDKLKASVDSYLLKSGYGQPTPVANQIALDQEKLRVLTSGEDQRYTPARDILSRVTAPGYGGGTTTNETVTGTTPKKAEEVLTTTKATKESDVVDTVQKLLEDRQEIKNNTTLTTNEKSVLLDQNDAALEKTEEGRSLPERASLRLQNALNTKMSISRADVLEPATALFLEAVRTGKKGVDAIKENIAVPLGAYLKDNKFTPTQKAEIADIMQTVLPGKDPFNLNSADKENLAKSLGERYNKEPGAFKNSPLGQVLLDAYNYLR